MTTITRGVSPDLSRTEFMTWYCEGDIMPRVMLQILQGGYDPNNFVASVMAKRDEGSVLVPIDTIINNFSGTVYIMCCLPHSPPEFTPVKVGKVYKTWFYPYAPAIPGVALRPDEVLVRAAPNMSNQDSGAYLVHPSLCPALFDRIFVARETLPGDVAVIWVAFDRYWVLQGRPTRFLLTTKYTTPGVDLVPGDAPFDPESTGGYGLIHFPEGKAPPGPKKGIFMVTRPVMRGSVATPVWNAWKIQPARDGGYGVPGAPECIVSGKALVGDIDTIR